MISLVSIELPIFQSKKINFSLSITEVLNMIINYNTTNMYLVGDMGLSGDKCSTTSQK